MTGLGGLPLPKRPDQQRTFPPAGVQPGSGAGIFSRLLVGGDFVVNSKGAFFYSPSPGAGNLAISIAQFNGTDPYGNLYPAGVTVYQHGTGIDVNLSGNQLTSVHSGTGNGSIVFIANELQILSASGGTAGTVTIVAPTTFITTGAGLPVSSDALEVNGAIATSSGTQKIVSGAVETVHQFTSGFPAGWTGTVSYWLLPDGVSSRVTMDFHLTIANGTVVTNNEDLLNAVGSSYHFTDNKFVFGQINGGGLAGNQFAPMRISSTGELFYGGPAFTAAGSAFFYGGSTYSVAV